MPDTCIIHPLGCRLAAIGRANIKAGWDALDAIREYVEDIAPPGSMRAQEYADNPEPMTEAQEIIKGIQAIVDAGKSKPAPDPFIDATKTGIFRDHSCYRCKSGDLPCVKGKGRERDCDTLHARND